MAFEDLEIIEVNWIYTASGLLEIPWWHKISLLPMPNMKVA